MRLAVQMYTLREFTKTAEGFREALEVVHGIGYEAVQLSAIGCMDAGEVSVGQAREWLDENGLECCATHRPWNRLMEETEAEVEFHRVLGCGYVAIGGYWGHGEGRDAYARFVAEAKPVLPRLAEAGLRFGYHHHAHEFIREDGEAQWEYVLRELPQAELEVDTYWVNHAGADSASLLSSLPGRVSVIHVKDKEVVPGDGPVMAPVGEGNLDWNRILDAARASGTEWLVVEQDVCRRDPFDCLASSFEFLSGRI